jgi:hypothetical protein
MISLAASISLAATQIGTKNQFSTIYQNGFWNLSVCSLFLPGPDANKPP